MRINIVPIILCALIAKTVFADYVDPTEKTNVNTQTDLFEKSVDDAKGMEIELEAGKSKTLRGFDNPKTIEDVTGYNGSKLEAETTGLKGIKASDLNDKGKEAMNQNHGVQDMFVDEDRPLFAAYARDAKNIAEASGRLLGRLHDVLKEIGVNCQTVKGNREVEPDYRIETVQEKTKDTVYSMSTCEELRNKYSCTDKLKLSCSRKGMEWESWQHGRSMTFDGPEAYSSYPWFYTRKVEREHFQHYINDIPWVRNEISKTIAAKLGVAPEQVEYIGEGRERGLRGLMVVQLGKKSYVQRYFKLLYKYREGHETCAEWNEEWRETCVLR